MRYCLCFTPQVLAPENPEATIVTNVEKKATYHVTALREATRERKAVSSAAMKVISHAIVHRVSFSISN